MACMSPKSITYHRHDTYTTQSSFVLFLLSVLRNKMSFLTATLSLLFFSLFLLLPHTFHTTFLLLSYCLPPPQPHTQGIVSISHKFSRVFSLSHHPLLQISLSALSHTHISLLSLSFQLSLSSLSLVNAIHLWSASCAVSLSAVSTNVTRC